MFLDSGTPPTILPTQFYDRVVAEVKNQVSMKPVGDDPDLGIQLCYRTKNNLLGPVLIAHFEGKTISNLRFTKRFCFLLGVHQHQ
ncbi:hypothetical protein LR48_Vigan07g100500 [Vigna angularis]|uniref:Xylanase inhibitor C-terminal domain-containing protein n=2 Tax=Phaseolus angularis TaxID=3914 RepID=A0A0L9UX44_PHAAN|nr:hypothetical protein LR48_Vigan07g100500 [Vigna angularis]BAT81455.1 hypothetical protein VIGAN_03117900 [Vigna angularis var. angularis]